jgi:precorrin isomerase
MSHTEILYAIGDAVTASFELLRMAGNNVNYLFLIIGVSLITWWMSQMAKENEQA